MRAIIKCQKLWLTSAWICFLSMTLTASPSADLGSPSQETRDAAAKILRATFEAPPRTNWNPLVEKLKLGIPKTNVLDILGHYADHVEGGGGSGITEMERYRLDDLWLLECSYTGKEASKSVLTHVKLIEQMLNVPVNPPSGFTGTWTIYYINGQKSGTGYYKNGKPDGASMGYYSDGSKALINHSANGILSGEELGFYPSGQIKYRGLYKEGSQAGTWTWYKEDGSVQSKKEFSRQK